MNFYWQVNNHIENLISLKKIKRRSPVSTTVWLHHLASNKTNVRCALFKTNLKAASNNTAVVWPLISLPTNYLRKARLSWRNKEGLRSKIFLLNSYTYTHQCTPTRKICIHQFFSKTGYRLENLQKSDDREGRMSKESQGNPCSWYILTMMYGERYSKEGHSSLLLSLSFFFFLPSLPCTNTFLKVSGTGSSLKCGYFRISDPFYPQTIVKTLYGSCNTIQRKWN